MGTRVLDWNGLLMAVEQSKPGGQAITFGGLPAIVQRHRGTDIGFYVKTASATANRLDGYWSLKKESELVLLREMVAAGLVTIDDPNEPERCFVAGCTDTHIDGRGGVRTTDGREHTACVPHREGALVLLALQQPTPDPEGQQ